MKLTYYSSVPTNFGDELNAFLWPKVLPEGFLDDDESDLFVGIGSILEDIFPRDKRKYVVGSGYGGYEALPDLERHNWEVVFVRGPLTAEKFGLPAHKAICDPAMLLRTLHDLPPPASGIGVAFMPHIDSLKRGNWKAACAMADLTFLDPTEPPETVISKIRGADLLLSEAMHGAIVADTLRVPWVGIAPFHRSHHRKWQDWAGALDMEVDLQPLPPSSLKELITRSAGGKGGHRLNSVRMLDSPIFRALNSALAWRAARALKRTRHQAVPQLSKEKKLDEVVERAGRALDDFVSRHRSA